MIYTCNIKSVTTRSIAMAIPSAITQYTINRSYTSRYANAHVTPPPANCRNVMKYDTHWN